MSVSNSMLRTLTALGLASTLGEGLRKHTPLAQEETHRLARLLSIQADRAIDLYPLPSLKQLIKAKESIAARLAKYTGKEFDATAHTSFVLSLLEEPLQKVKDPTRRSAIEKVVDSLSTLHEHFVNIGCNEDEGINIAEDINKEWEKEAICTSK